MRNGNYIIFSGEVDEFDKPVERTRYTHPYSYDGFVVWRGGKNEEVNSTVYSDRLLQQDYKKTRKLMQKHFGESGDYWNNRTHDKIEAFLREWLGKKKLRLILVMEYCNVSNGYPLWRFDYHI